MSDRDWTEDADHENGQYQCQCLTCGNMFVGHKRRVVCHTCAYPRQYPLLHHAAQLARQLEAAGAREATHFAFAAGLPNGSFRWRDGQHVECIYVWVERDGVCRAWSRPYGEPDFTFRVGDPLPAALLAAIKETT